MLPRKSTKPGGSMGRPSTRRAANIRPASADDLLNSYLKLLSKLPLFKPEEEAEYARRLRMAELETWTCALYLPSSVDYLLAGETLAEFSALPKLVQLERSYTRSGVAADGAPRRAAKITREVVKLAEELRDFDNDRIIADRLVEHLRAITPAHTDTPSRTNRRGLAPHRPSRVQIREVLRSHAESMELRNRFVRANLRLVVSVARGFHHFKLPLVDLIQEGNLGLIKAVHRFDHRKGFRFSTYAHWWIRQSIERAIVNKGAQVRVPVHVFDTRRVINRATRDLRTELGRDATDEELAAATGMDLEKIVAARDQALKEPLSLDDILSDTDERNYGDVLADEDSPHPEESVIREDEIQRVRELLGLLSPIEMDVICRRFGLLGDNDETLEEIGRKYNLSRERVRQIQVQGLKKMRRFCERREIGEG
ncbi:MAG: sigma-70 family RNA polymerase sigma factor [Pseudomonadota bacterium]